MANETSIPSDRASPPDPQRDGSGRTVPERIAAVLHAVRTLLGFGRHLKETAPQRAAEPNFTTIAVGFGTARLAAILAHLNRGILRAMALEQVLLERAATGRDLEFLEPGRRAKPSAPVPDCSAEPSAAAAPARTAARRPSRPAGASDGN